MEEAHLLARFRRVLLAGLVVLVPAALTVAVLLWLFRTLDGVLGPAINQLTGRQIPGLGLAATLAVVFVLGLISRNVFGNRVVGAAEGLVQRIPIARSLYAASKGVLASLVDRPADAFKRVVLFEYPRHGLWSIGFVTGSLRPQAEAAPVEDLLTIFLPTSPNPTSGYLLLVPRSETTELPFSVEEGIRLVISGGILRPPQWGEPPKGRNSV